METARKGGRVPSTCPCALREPGPVFRAIVCLDFVDDWQRKGFA
jgi:hypothetical protein